MKFKILLVTIAISICVKTSRGQTQIGNDARTMMHYFEYYHHTDVQEWIKLFKIKNDNAYLGFWSRGGVSGRAYFVDYDGQGGSFVDFSFPQVITATQKPVITMNGASAADLEWYAVNGSDGPGQDYYDVYVKTPIWNVGLSFLIRGSDYISYFTAFSPPATSVWSYATNPESFTFFAGTGNLGLGTITPSERLSVNGKVRAKEIKVENSNWPDYVFKKEYKLPSLAATENFIRENGHLPNIPSADEIANRGIELGDMTSKMLRKIEELTLHQIAQDKLIKAQQLEIKRTQVSNQNLQRRVQKLSRKLKTP